MFTAILCFRKNDNPICSTLPSCRKKDYWNGMLQCPVMGGTSLSGRYSALLLEGQLHLDVTVPCYSRDNSIWTLQCPVIAGTTPSGRYGALL